MGNSAQTEDAGSPSTITSLPLMSVAVVLSPTHTLMLSHTENSPRWRLAGLSSALAFPLDLEARRFAEGSGAGGVQTAKASRLGEVSSALQ